jgi:hypothetical protein
MMSVNEFEYREFDVPEYPGVYMIEAKYAWSSDEASIVLNDVDLKDVYVSILHMADDWFCYFSQKSLFEYTLRDYEVVHEDDWENVAWNDVVRSVLWSCSEITLEKLLLKTGLSFMAQDCNILSDYAFYVLLSIASKAQKYATKTLGEV